MGRYQQLVENGALLGIKASGDETGNSFGTALAKLIRILRHSKGV